MSNSGPDKFATFHANKKGQAGICINLDPVYTGLVTMAQVLYLLEICCLG